MAGSWSGCCGHRKCPPRYKEPATDQTHRHRCEGLNTSIKGTSLGGVVSNSVTQLRNSWLEEFLMVEVLVSLISAEARLLSLTVVLPRRSG
ncbi:hypothetical protein INR49_007733 [Caranx melampygus]|nr:hypothetical protein INR49_007733 [Caranx melampygus]